MAAGLSNAEVARFLLQNGLHHVDACVYLDEHDTAMVILRRDMQRPVPLSRCGVPPERRYVNLLS